MYSDHNDFPTNNPLLILFFLFKINTHKLAIFSRESRYTSLSAIPIRRVPLSKPTGSEQRFLESRSTRSKPAPSHWKQFFVCLRISETFGIQKCNWLPRCLRKEQSYLGKTRRRPLSVPAQRQACQLLITRVTQWGFASLTPYLPLWCTTPTPNHHPLIKTARSHSKAVVILEARKNGMKAAVFVPINCWLWRASPDFVEANSQSKPIQHDAMADLS